MTITATTTQHIQYHGWSIPAGTTVVLKDIVRDGYRGLPTATATNLADWNVAIPTWAVDVNVWESELPIRYV